VSVIFLLNSCQKKFDKQATEPIQAPKAELPAKVNPFSVRNIEKAKASLAARGEYRTEAKPQGFSTEPQFVYFRFDPQKLSQEQFVALENDPTVHLMEIPFANIELYNENLALDEAKAETFKDGNVYGITPISNTNIFSKLTADQNTNTIYLDTLVEVAEEDTALQFQAMREAGNTEEQINRIRICLFKKPHGYVRYWDNQLNRFEPVRGMEVWALFLGIPMTTYSDANGYYEINWRFSIGTIMGTKAKNSRVNVKPLYTYGTFIEILPTLIAQFIVGSVHVESWVTPCRMKDGFDFNFTGHTQVRYWSQILNAYFFHDQYAADERIQKAPAMMTCYAHWADTRKFIDNQGVPSFGQSSTPMLGHISVPWLLAEYFTDVFDGLAPTNYPNLFNLLTGLLPDMTIRVPGATEPQFYNSRLTQTLMHELSHASQFNRVGNLFWVNFIQQTLNEVPAFGNPYGNGSDAQYIDITESWGYFLGMNFAMRRYPGAAGMLEATNSNGIYQVNNYYRMDNLIENEWFYYDWRWMPYGLYHDLMDNTNIAPNNPNETWDNIQGVTIRQLFEALGPEVRDMCAYRNNFTQLYPALNQAAVNRIFDVHNAICR